MKKLNDHLEIIEKSLTEQKQNLSTNIATVRNIDSLYITPLIEQERNSKTLPETHGHNIYLNKVIRLINGKTRKSNSNENGNKFRLSRSNSFTEKRAIKLKREWINSVNNKLNNKDSKEQKSDVSPLSNSLLNDNKTSIKLEDKPINDTTIEKETSVTDLSDIIGDIDICLYKIHDNNNIIHNKNSIIQNTIRKQLKEWKSIRSQYTSQQKHINETITKLNTIKYKVEEEIAKNENELNEF